MRGTPCADQKLPGDIPNSHFQKKTSASASPCPLRPTTLCSSRSEAAPRCCTRRVPVHLLLLGEGACLCDHRPCSIPNDSGLVCGFRRDVTTRSVLDACGGVRQLAESSPPCRRHNTETNSLLWVSEWWWRNSQQRSICDTDAMPWPLTLSFEKPSTKDSSMAPASSVRTELTTIVSR